MVYLQTLKGSQSKSNHMWVWFWTFLFSSCILNIIGTLLMNLAFWTLEILSFIHFQIIFVWFYKLPKVCMYLCIRLKSLALLLLTLLTCTHTECLFLYSEFWKVSLVCIKSKMFLIDNSLSPISRRAHIYTVPHLFLIPTF